MSSMPSVYQYRAQDRFPALSFPLSVEKTPQTSVVPPHTHDFVEVVFVAKGRGIHHTFLPDEVTHATGAPMTEQASSYPIMQGDVFVVAPHEPHTYIQNESLVLYNILFFPDLLKDDYPHLMQLPGLFNFFLVEPFFRNESSFRGKFHLAVPEQQALEQCLERIMEELAEKRPGFEIAAKAKFLECLVVIGRSRLAQPAQSPEQVADMQGKQQAIQHAIAYMEENFSSQLTLEMIAHQVYFSASYFCELFKTHTGMSPWEYLTHMRLEQARHLLADTGKSITDIAMQVGFSDSGYFAKVFKLKYGVSPRAYRQEREKLQETPQSLQVDTETLAREASEHADSGDEDSLGG